MDLRKLIAQRRRTAYKMIKQNDKEAGIAPAFFEELRFSELRGQGRFLIVDSPFIYL
jgi:hypothetical protein